MRTPNARYGISSRFLNILKVSGVLAAAALIATAPLAARADEPAKSSLTVKGKAFMPTELDVPAGQRIKITIKNEDDEPAEFESFALNREKVVPANDQVVVYLDPLKPGTYTFFNDFGTAKGKIVAK